MPVSNEEVAILLSVRGGTASAAEVAKVRAAIKAMDDDTRRVTASTLNWAGAYKQLQGPVSSVNRVVDRGLVGLTALTGGAVAWGLKTASSYELSRSALGALLGDVGKGNVLFKQLQSYNLAAPFDFQGIAAAEQTLIQFGIAGDKALPVLKGLGDVAAMTSNPTQNLQSMAVALGQISSAGVMRAQDLNQLVQAGFPAYQLLAEITGKTSIQLRKDMETGLTLPSEHFVDAIERMQGAVLERYKGGAKKQNDTLYGQWSNFKDLMARNLERGIRPAVPDIKKELPVLARGFADAIERIGPQLPQLVRSATELAPVLIDVAGGFAGLLAEVVPVVDTVSDLLGPTGVKVLLATLLGFRALTGVAGAVNTFSTALATLRAVEAGTTVGAGAGAAGAGAAGRRGRVGRAGKGLGLLAAIPFAAEFVGNATDKFNGDNSDGFLGSNQWFGGSVGRVARQTWDAGSWVGSHAGDSPFSPFHDRSGGKSAGAHKTVNINGNVIIDRPTSDIDVANAFEYYVRQREERD